jgi:hypothetical protein
LQKVYLVLVIRFEKYTTNKVVVTLTENSTATNPFYLFQFTNQTSNVDYYFIATDLSTHKERFNEFSVTERDTPNTLAGQVELGDTGFYNYTIYQTSLSTLSGLTNASQAVNSIVKEVEKGKVWVVPSVDANYIYNGQDTTAIVYNPEDNLMTEDGYYLLQENGFLINI